MFSKPYTFICIHGALMGGWSWDKLRSALESAGHEVITPDLPGRSEDPRAHVDINLMTHVDSLEAYLQKASHPVVMLAHSMGGIVASMLAERHPDRVRKLIYLTAYAPRNGESLAEVFEDYFKNPVDYDAATMSIRRGLQWEPEAVIEIAYSDCNDETQAIIRQKLCDEPAQPSFDKLVLSSERFGQVDKAYVTVKGDRVIPLELQVKMADWHEIGARIEMVGEHGPMLSDPDGLVDKLADLLEAVPQVKPI